MPIIRPGPDHDTAREAAGQYQGEDDSAHQAHGNPRSIALVGFFTVCRLRSCARLAPARSFPPRMQVSLLVFALHNSKLEGYQQADMKPGGPT